MGKNGLLNVELRQVTDERRASTTSYDAKIGASHSEYARRKSSVVDQVHMIDEFATAPTVTLDSFAHLDKKKILRKMDLHLLPMLTALYLLSFLDRGNIGNAKVQIPRAIL